MKIAEIGRLPGLLAASLLATAPAAAQLTVVDDGCGVLRGAILAQAAPDPAAAGKPSVLRALPDEPVAPDPPHYCMDTAATATAAFGAAMHAAGIPVSWGSAGVADYCDSRTLAGCYPRVLSGELASAAELQFVHDAWSAVVGGLAGVMPYGVTSDAAMFERQALESAIRRRLQPDPQAVLRTKSGQHQE